MAEKRTVNSPNTNLSAALGFSNHAAASTGEICGSPLSRVTGLLDANSFRAAFSQTADFGIRTTTGKKRDNLRNSSGTLAGGIETRSSSKNSVEVEFGSLRDCPVLILAVIELPLCLHSAFFSFPSLADMRRAVLKL